ncbi:hypothetical protein [Thermocatellispora tengchongensis]|uniref:hypothetical protein n=1 Tax=Thermocatellispora tengchongensis TaxID=1073253 RepID=UPI0036401F85
MAVSTLARREVIDRRHLGFVMTFGRVPPPRLRAWRALRGGMRIGGGASAAVGRHHVPCGSTQSAGLLPLAM